MKGIIYSVPLVAYNLTVTPLELADSPGTSPNLIKYFRENPALDNNCLTWVVYHQRNDP